MTERPEIAQLGSTTLSTADIDRSLWFFRDLLGMEEVDRDGDSVYLRAFQELEHHSLILKDSNVNQLESVSWRTSRPEDVEAFARQLHDTGVEVVEAAAGTKKGQGDSIRFFTPHGGHPFELFYDIDRPKAPEAIRSKLPSNSSTRRGLGVRRIDHVNLHTATEAVAPTEAFLREHLGFKRRESFSAPGGPLVATWTSVTPQVHDVAIVANPDNAVGRLHHVAFNVESYSDSLTAADVLRDQGVQIDLGPGKHGIGQAMFLYVRDPGSGHRIEIYAGGYLIFAPDWQPIDWRAEDFADGLTWYGEPLPLSGHAMSETTPSTSKLI